MIHPASGVLLRGEEYGSFRKAIEEHEKGNGYLRLTEQEIQNILCASLPLGATNCAAYDPNDSGAPQATRRVTINDAINFTQVIGAGIKNALAGGRSGFVDQAEANRRAQICLVCPKNVTVEGCTSCRNLINWIAQVVGKKTTPLDGSLNGCAVCGCELRTAVHVELDIQRKGITPEMDQEFIPGCWKKKKL